jgi:hypothetical protein
MNAVILKAFTGNQADELTLRLRARQGDGYYKQLLRTVDAVRGPVDTRLWASPAATVFRNNDRAARHLSKFTGVAPKAPGSALLTNILPTGSGDKVVQPMAIWSAIQLKLF